MRFFLRIITCLYILTSHLHGKVAGQELAPKEVVSPSPSSQGCILLVADLSGEDIFPEPIATNTTGSFKGWVDGEAMIWEMTVNNIEEMTFSHIHLGNASTSVPIPTPVWGPIWLYPAFNSTDDAQAANDVLNSGWTNLTADTTTTGSVFQASLAAVPSLKPTFNGTETFTGALTSDQFAGPLASFKMKQFLSYAEDGLAYVNVHTTNYLIQGILRGPLRVQNTCDTPSPPIPPSSARRIKVPLGWGLGALTAAGFLLFG
jgi:hypothetical protein